MAKTAKVIKESCIGCGVCTAIASAVFGFGADGLAENVLGTEVPADLEASVEGVGYVRKFRDCFLISKQGEFSESILITEYISKFIDDKYDTYEPTGNVIYTLEDVIASLKKPNLDPRDEMPQPVLKSDVLDIKDLIV